jgi:hypothetical protein
MRALHRDSVRLVHRQLCWSCLVLVLGACQPAVSPAPSPRLDVPVGIPPGAVRYRFVPAESQLLVLVYRGGTLARLGHNHVVSVASIRGDLWLAEPLQLSVFELRLPVAEFRVDDPALRAAQGEDFVTEVDAEAIAGTRRNMLGAQQLDAANWPEIVLRSVELVPEVQPSWRAVVEVVTRGVSSRVAVPVSVELSGSELTVAGSLTLRQTDLGLEPFSVMLGALEVRDDLDIRFRLVARPAPAPDGEG